MVTETNTDERGGEAEGSEEPLELDGRGRAASGGEVEVEVLLRAFPDSLTAMETSERTGVEFRTTQYRLERLEAKDEVVRRKSGGRVWVWRPTVEAHPEELRERLDAKIDAVDPADKIEREDTALGEDPSESERPDLTDMEVTRLSRMARIVQVLIDGFPDSVTAVDVQESTKIPKSTVLRHLERLEERGEVVSRQVSGRAVVWRPTVEAYGSVMRDRLAAEIEAVGPLADVRVGRREANEAFDTAFDAAQRARRLVSEINAVVSESGDPSAMTAADLRAAFETGADPARGDPRQRVVDAVEEARSESIRAEEAAQLVEQAVREIESSDIESEMSPDELEAAVRDARESANLAGQAASSAEAALETELPAALSSTDIDPDPPDSDVAE